MKRTAISLLLAGTAAFFLTLNLASCGDTSASSTKPDSSITPTSEKESSLPASEPKASSISERASSEPVSSLDISSVDSEVSSVEPEESSSSGWTPEQKQAEFDLMVSAYNGLVANEDDYSIYRYTSDKYEYNIHFEQLDDSYSSYDYYEYNYGYEPDSCFFMDYTHDNSTWGDEEPNTQTKLYLKEEDKEYLYSSESAYPDYSYYSLLSDGHIDYMGEQYQTTLENYIIFSDYETGTPYTSFDDIKLTAETVDYYIYDGYDSVIEDDETYFVMPTEYELTSQSLDIEFLVDEDSQHHFADFYYVFSYDMKDATTPEAGSTLVGVDEASVTYIYSAVFEYMEGETFGWNCQQDIIYSGSGNNGSDTYENKTTYNLEFRYDAFLKEDDIPAKADSYYEKSTAQGWVYLLDSNDNFIDDFTGNLDEELVIDESELEYTYGTLYTDPDMTIPYTGTIEYKTYEQYFYAAPKAKDENKVLLMFNFLGKATRSYYNSYDGDCYTTPWKVYDIDENGQVDLSTYTGTVDNKVYTVDEITVGKTNDPADEDDILDGTTLNVSHDYYYYLIVKGTAI